MLRFYARRCFYLLCIVLSLASHRLYAQTDLALNKVTAASTAIQSAANAVDNNGGTRWESAIKTDPSWISVDLGQQYGLTRVVIDWEDANAANYQVQGSNNNTSWNELAPARSGGIFGIRTDIVNVAGNYRYVRIFATARPAGNQWGYSIFSLKVYGGAPVASSSAASVAAVSNLALGRSATGASTDLQPAANAVDGLTGSRWESAHGVGTRSISVDLGSEKSISSVVIDWEAANAANYQVLGSRDNNSWAPLAADRTGGIFGVRTDTISVTASGNYRYVRVNATLRSAGNQWGYSIFELKVFGTNTTPTASSAPASSVPRSSLPRSSLPRSSVTGSSTPAASVAGSSFAAASSTPVALGDIIPLYNGATALEPETVIDRGDHVETTFSDRGRDRHAREVRKEPVPAFTSETGFLRNMEAGSGYDHYLAHYWIGRTATVIIRDYIAKGGTYVDIELFTLVPLRTHDTRFFFLGTGTVAEYYNNAYVTQVPGEVNHYKLSLSPNNPVLRDYWKTTDNIPSRPLRLGDRIEMEISQFLRDDSVSPAGSRNNYYGTVLLYLVGGGKGLATNGQPNNGLVPWVGKPTRDTNLTTGQVLTCLPSNTEPNCPTVQDSFPLATKAWLGGRTTLPYNYSGEPWHAFKQLASNTGGGYNPAGGGNAQLFMLGRRLVHTNMQTGAHSELPQTTSGDVQTNEPFAEMQGKVGPRFYAASCVGCHFNNGRSIPRGVGVTIDNQAIKIGSNSAGSPHAQFGGSLQPFSTLDGSNVGEAQTQLTGFAAAPNYADGTVNSLTTPRYAFLNGPAPAFFSVRNSPAFVGFGLLGAVEEADILAIAAANNGAGISGRPQKVKDPVTGQTRLGRFGWKAGTSSTQHQVASALNVEMGVTTSVLPRLDCGATQPDCQTGAELNNTDLDHIVRYMNTLGVPARRDMEDPQALRGELVFAETNCVGCHKETLKTTRFSPLAEVRSETFHPYTDLLLHDMGPGLADNLGEGEAAGNEWRTAPLWGIGLTAAVSGGNREAYLHDGRAKTLDEAIRWHDGEAANSRRAYLARSQSDKDALIKFLKSL